MIALLLISALLGLALIIDNSGDDDTDEVNASEEEVTTRPEQQLVSNGFLGTDAAEDLRLDADGGFAFGAGGDDTISGSDNTDGLLGGDGNDVIFAFGGNDVVSGDAGNDRIFLGDGDDDYTPDDATYSNNAGDDFVRGGDGRDFISDLLGSNTLRGDLGPDTLIAVDGLSEIGNYGNPSELGTTDTLHGGFGADILFGDDGDIMTGGAGTDRFLVTEDEEVDLEEVRITDFDVAEDTLFVVQLDGLTSASDLAYEETDQGVLVSFEGRTVALLEGLTEVAIPAIRTNVVDLAGLENIN